MPIRSHFLLYFPNFQEKIFTKIIYQKKNKNDFWLYIVCKIFFYILLSTFQNYFKIFHFMKIHCPKNENTISCMLEMTKKY